MGARRRVCAVASYAYTQYGRRAHLAYNVAYKLTWCWAMYETLLTQEEPTLQVCQTCERNREEWLKHSWERMR